MTIGILAVQGALIEHEQALQKLGIPFFEIRNQHDLQKPFDGLILPGGESTVMGKLLHDLGLYEPLKQKIVSGMPVFGTCAGMILLAHKLYEDQTVHLGCMDIVARRNAYGRQLGSFHTTEAFTGIGNIPMVFIRAPYIDTVGKDVEILSTVDGHIVAARQHHMLVTSFHPELTDHLGVHQYFLSLFDKPFRH